MDIQEQERKDYAQTKKIMERIFAAYDASVEMSQTKPFSAYDAKMKINGKRKYTVEIKERSSTEYDTMPLKVKKYCSIMESTKEDETPIAIYLVGEEHYYIFNLRKLDLNKVVIKNWNIPKVQFSDRKEYEPQPTFFIPISMCVYDGEII